MAKFEISDFKGIAPKLNAAMIGDSFATVADNCLLGFGDARPLLSAGAVTTTPRVGLKKSLFRLGYTSDETQYWLTWLSSVDVARGPIAGDTSERIYYTGDGAPKMTYIPLAIAGGSAYPVAYRDLGVQAPDTALTAAVATNGADENIEQEVVYVVTFVTDLGEEGPPSPPSAQLLIREGASIALSQIPAPGAGVTHITKKRIYRSLSSSTAADYLFVVELPSAATTYTDTAGSDDLNESLATLNYAPPLSTLQGLTALQNGMMAAFDGNDLYFCEPFLPYAWPTEYSQAVDYKIVGLAAFGQSVLAGTTGTPYLFTGVDPAGMTMERVDFNQSCLAKESMVSVGSGAVYAAPDGLAYVGSGGARIVTESMFTAAQWKAYKPESMRCFFVDGQLIIFYDTGAVNGSLILHWEAGVLSKSSVWCDAGFFDPQLGELYLIQGDAILKWNAGSSLTYTWRSKIIAAGDGFQPSAALVEADAYPVTFKLYRDGTLAHTQTVSKRDAFRLPPGRAETFQMEITASAPISRIALATSISELRGA